MRHLSILAVLLATPVVGCAQTVPPAAAAPTTPLVQRERFTVEVVGDGPDVILIPGLSTPREVWAATAERLGATHRLHLVQLRGFGDPAGPNATGPVLQPFAADLARYIREAGLDRPAVVGHSMGGLAALMLASGEPTLTSRLVIVDALPFIGTLFSPGATVAAIRPQAEGMRATMLAAAADPSIRAALAERTAGTLAKTDAARAAVARWSLASDPAVSAQALVDDMGTDVRPDLAGLTVPVTVIVPTDDGVRPAGETLAFYRAQFAGTPRLTITPVADSAHFVMLDQPLSFAEALEAALAERP